VVVGVVVASVEMVAEGTGTSAVLAAVKEVEEMVLEASAVEATWDML